MKIKRELAEVFDQACKDVGTWEVWQRSLDPQGGHSTKALVIQLLRLMPMNLEMPKF